MAYFSSFPAVEYTFGTEKSTDVFRNIAIYSTIIDQIKNEIALYEDYTITENERPDQLSYSFYNNPNYHWTFFLMNNKLRERGWPLSNADLLKYAKRNYPNKTLKTLTPLINFTSFFKSGDTVEGRISGATGKVVHRNLNLGNIDVEVTSGTFIANENIQVDGTSELVLVSSVVDQYLSSHHYENGGEYVDIESNGIPSPGAFDTEITIFDEIARQNNDLKQIRVIKPNSIAQVVSSFKEAIRS